MAKDTKKPMPMKNMPMMKGGGKMTAGAGSAAGRLQKTASAKKGGK